MPIRLREMEVPDPFKMNKNQVSEYIAKFLETCRFDNVVTSTSRGDWDVTAKVNDWRIYVDAKGSRAVKHKEDVVFADTQLVKHLADQVSELMRYYQTMDESGLLFMGNPDLPRIREIAEEIDRSLDHLGIIRLWVQQDGTVQVEAPSGMAEIMKQIGL
ncbi:hypothetical protein [Tumebacillus permanentifrigoris]|uniref:Restriction endonuclease n=1 Tax=Tumebacillus permanentifrigoris TaxID=378543 RepID=A0A316DAR7_9BACL|nr:hypothetical protein [Tumebacillus permanentifrigoris]PWK14399.1 hypothetical protein C7459_105156 [Tumebacillus permanentifrigoris]